ncbi:MAG: histidine kinase, partial [Bacteroidota bacterium]
LIYLLASLAFGFTLTSLMYGLRVPLYKLVGIDRLAEIFNDLPWRYLMEYFKQFFVFMLIYFVYRGINEYHKNREREQQEVVLRQELLKAQIQGLQMQLHPHFFFNTLNTISSVMYHNPARADRLISQLSKFLRNVIDLKDQQLHPLEKEIELLQQFTDVMKERYRDQLFVQFDIAETCTAYAVPVLILQPLVENAIKYAIDHQEQTEVRVQAQCEEERLLLEVIDNGPGIREGSLTKGTGLSATIARLQKLYPDQYQFDMQNRTQGGLQISINLPASRSMLVTH